MEEFLNTPYVLLLLIPFLVILVFLLRDYLRKMDEILGGKRRR